MERPYLAPRLTDPDVFNILSPERALSPPGSGGLFSSNKTASAFVAGSEAYPVNKALTAVSASQRPASPMGMAILKGQFLD